VAWTNKLDVSPLSPVGIAASDLTGAQRDQLLTIVETYTSKMADDIERRADRRQGRLPRAA
jgi:hypothetical protein